MPADSYPHAIIERMVRTAFPRGHLAEVTLLTGGLRNSNFKIHLDSPVVLRIYEHDPSLCRKEIDLFRFIADVVPIPELIHAEPDGIDDLPPFVLMQFVEGITFRDLRATGDAASLAQAAFSAGEALAAIGRHGFAMPGWISPGPRVTAPLLEGADPFPRFIDLCLQSENLRARVPAALRGRIHDLAWSAAAQFAVLDSETQLVHGDFSGRNLLVRTSGGTWSVAAVLDWEFAISGSPLADIGNFLRYETRDRPRLVPHFSAGYVQGGGVLPSDWRRLSRLIDLAAICECLSRTGLPDDASNELVEILSVTADQARSASTL